jgi:protein-disulfide isomerase
MNEHEHTSHPHKESKNKPNNERAILISGTAISLAILMHGALVMNSGKSSSTSSAVDKSLVLEVMKKPISNRYFGDQTPTEEIVFTEYSDTECPFCKNFHETMKAVMAEGNGRYAWVYKHFPLSFHPNAQKEAEAIECVRSIDGDTKAFQYMDSIFAVTPSNNKLPPEALYEIASIMKISTKKLKACVEAGTFAGKVKAELEEGTQKGVQGTPYTFVTQNKAGTTTELGTINGAQPKEAIDAVLLNIK